jgi:tetratricopeptide (TPR) repeat protein
MITGVCIVKNEQGRIIPTLESFAPFVDRFVVCDTGSVDKTIDEVTSYLDGRKDSQSELLAFKFADYSQARNEALRLSDDGPGWLLMFDCDMRIAGETLSLETELQAASLPCQLGSSRFDRRCLFRGGLGFAGPGTREGWHFVGAVHEVAVGPGDVFRLPSPVLTYEILDHERRAKRWREKDLPLLSRDKDTNPRSAFYFAQTLECLKEFEQAIEAYRARIKMGGYHEDLYTSQMRIGDCQYMLGQRDSALASWLIAFGMSPYRAEPLEKISREMLSRGYLEAAWHYAQGAAQLPYPSDCVLFVDSDLYETRAKAYLSAVESMIRSKERNK